MFLYNHCEFIVNSFCFILFSTPQSVTPQKGQYIVSVKLNYTPSAKPCVAAHISIWNPKIGSVPVPAAQHMTLLEKMGTMVQVGRIIVA